MPGRVTADTRGNPAVNISGTNYTVSSPLQFSHGEALLLKVAGLTPVVEFSIVEGANRNVRNSDVTSVILSDKFLQSTTMLDRNLGGSLTSLIGLLHTNSSVPLPPATILLINSMRNRLLRSGGLVDPKSIQNSILNGSLLVGSQGAIAGFGTTENGLLTILMQIVNSLNAQRIRNAGFPSGSNYQRSIGLALYQSSEVELLNNFSRRIEEQHSNLLGLRNKAQEDLQQQAYRLLIELPVVFRNHVSSVRIHVGGRKKSSKQESTSDTSSVEFEFELRYCGKVYTRIFLADSAASFFIGCERHAAADYLNESKKVLEGRLAVYGLKLASFTASRQAGYLSSDFDHESPEQIHEVKHCQNMAAQALEVVTEESTRLRMHEIHAKGMMPELEEFSLRVNNQDVLASVEIPEYLYCAMAGFFAHLFEAEKG